MALSRKPTLKEIKLLSLLIKKSKMNIAADWVKTLIVTPMDDGGMGSLNLFEDGKINRDRLMGTQISDIQLKDIDGIDVIISLNLDTEGRLFELDVWKTDFSKIIDIQLPETGNVSSELAE